MWWATWAGVVRHYQPAAPGEDEQQAGDQRLVGGHPAPPAGLLQEGSHRSSVSPLMRYESSVALQRVSTQSLGRGGRAPDQARFAEGAGIPS